MIDFMKWKLQLSGFKKINSTNRRPIITHHVAHHPKHLNVRVLPDEYKKELTEKFYEFLEWVKNNHPSVIIQATDIVNGVVNYMNSESYYKEYWNEFLSYTKKLDDIRQESIADVEPKFKEYIK